MQTFLEGIRCSESYNDDSKPIHLGEVDKTASSFDEIQVNKINKDEDHAVDVNTRYQHLWPHFVKITSEASESKNERLNSYFLLLFQQSQGEFPQRLRLGLKGNFSFICPKSFADVVSVPSNSSTSIKEATIYGGEPALLFSNEEIDDSISFMRISFHAARHVAC
ncbi:hypothetical protein ACH5RR_000904 [Cinchona calisaya]|uniref:Uncharacterized protein n=1 Tax=Cinchona calisaya TaxID=153742 RepID=A0ABD3B2J4_9GENT